MVSPKLTQANPKRRLADIPPMAERESEHRCRDSSPPGSWAQIPYLEQRARVHVDIDEELRHAGGTDGEEGRGLSTVQVGTISHPQEDDPAYGGGWSC